MLEPCVQSNGISIWSDEKILPGQRWRTAIDDALISARIAILLVSPDFLASDFIMKRELPALIHAERNGRILITWVAIRPCMYGETIIEQFQAINDPSGPLATVEPKSLETHILKVCYRIKEMLLVRQAESNESGRYIQSVREGEMSSSKIQNMLEQLEKAKQRRDSSHRKMHEDILASLESKRPIEYKIFDLMTRYRGQNEETVVYDVKLLATVEEIALAGRDPESYGLPSFNDALATLGEDVRGLSDMGSAIKGILEGVQKSSTK
jgi:hypothetical protein